MGTFRILAPNEMRIAYECQAKGCGFLLIAPRGKGSMEFATTSCPACTVQGKEPAKKTFKNIVDQLEQLAGDGVRFVVPNEEG